MESLDVLGKRAKAASRQMAKFKITKKNEVLEMVADELIKKADEIKKANKADVDEAVKNASKLAVLDKNVTFGIGGALYTDIKAKIHKEAYGFIIGLGGRDITPESILEVYEKTKNPEKEVTWIGLKEE